MTVPLEQFQSEVELLQQDIKVQLLKRQTPRQELIEDGIVNLVEYYNSPIRIMWVLKEPHGGGGWSMPHQLNTIRALGKDRGAWQTWYPLTYTTYGLLNGYMPSADMPNINRDPAVWLSLRKIAFVNFKKLPGRTQTNMTELGRQVTAEERKLVARQIETYRPHIVIFGKTFNLLKADLALSGEHELAHGHFQKDGKLFINTYHPAQNETSDQAYIDQIISVGKRWQDVYNGALV